MNFVAGFLKLVEKFEFSGMNSVKIQNLRKNFYNYASGLYNSVRNWLDSFEKYGLEGLEDPPSFWPSAINFTQKITKNRACI